VFHQIDGAPVSKGRELRHSSPVLNRAAREIVQAKTSYRACVAQFGTNPWVDTEAVREFSADELVGWMLEGTEVL
jgi:hypothetical protein